MYLDKVDKNKLKKLVNENNLLKCKKNIVAIGIDQGYANLGWSIIKYNINTGKYHILDFGTIKTKSSDELSTRLNAIYNKLTTIINKNEIDIAGCERLFVAGNRSSDGGKKRNKSASIVNTSMSTGVIFLLASQHDININDFPPTTVKKQLTGNGRADKENLIEVIDALLQEQNIKVKTNHESDAIAIGITTISSFIEKLLK